VNSDPGQTQMTFTCSKGKLIESPEAASHCLKTCQTSPLPEIPDYLISDLDQTLVYIEGMEIRYFFSKIFFVTNLKYFLNDAFSLVTTVLSQI